MRNEYALITGASSGIGLEYARQLAAEGYNLILVGNQADENCRVAESLASQYGVCTLPIYADLAREGAAEELFARVGELPIEVLISNAGMLLFSTLAHTPDLAATSARQKDGREGLAWCSAAR